MRLFSVSLLVLLLVVSLPGCIDRRELEEIGWVQAMGFDLHPKGVVTTLQVGVPRNIQNGLGMAGQGPSYVTVSALSKTALEALDMASLTLGRALSLSHCQLIVFGEELARNDVRALCSALDRYREIRGTVTVAVVLGNAADIIRTLGSPVEASPIRAIESLRALEKETGLVESGLFVKDLVNFIESPAQSPSCPLIALTLGYESSGGEQGGQQNGGQDPVHDYESTPDVGTEFPVEEIPPHILEPEGDPTDVLPSQMPKIGGSPVIAEGAALFQGGKMVGTLTGEECKAVLMVKRRLQRAVIIVPDPQKPDDPQYSLGAIARGHGSEIRVRREGDKVEIDVEVDLVVSYLSMKTQTDYSDPRFTPLAEQAIAARMKESLDRAIAKTQGLGSDVFGFGQKVRKTFRTYPEFEDFAWLTKYSDAIIRTEVTVDIRRYGMTLGPLYAPPSEYIRKGQ